MTQLSSSLTTTAPTTFSNDTDPITLTTSVVFAFRAKSGKTSTPQHHKDILLQHNLQRYAYGYVMLIICGCGVLGNVLALAVLSRKSMRSSSTAAYLRCLAAVDTCVLVLAIFRYRCYHVLLSEMDVIHIILDFDSYVQVYVVPFFWIFLGVSSFITMSLSLERYLVIRWPFTLQKSCRVGVVRGGTALAVLVVFLVTLPHFLCYRIRRDSFRGLPVAAIIVDNRYVQAKAYLRAYNNYLLPIVWYMAPWVVVAVVNALLAWQVQKSSRIRVGVPNSLNPNRNLSLLIILIVGVYMICHFPRCILEMYCLVNKISSTDDGGSDTDGDCDSTRAFLVFNMIADVLNILNSCLNIVVYCFTGTRFRKEVKRLLLCRSCCQNTTAPQPPPTHHQSLHVSLREVPATPINTRKSFNMSCKELQLARGDHPRQAQEHQPHRQHLPTSSPSSSCMSSSLSPRGSQAHAPHLLRPAAQTSSPGCTESATISRRHSDTSLVSSQGCRQQIQPPSQSSTD